MHKTRWTIILALIYGISLGLLAAPDSSAGTITVAPGESIQDTIDRASEGAVVALQPGDHEATLLIDKSLTLRGLGETPDQVRISGATPEAVIRIETDKAIEVTIENLTVTDGKTDGIVVHNAARVTLIDVHIKQHGRIGLWATDSVEVTARGCHFSGNGSTGIYLRNEVRMTLKGSTITNNGCCGLDVWDSTRVTMSDSTVAKNADAGIRVWGSPKVAIYRSSISDNRWNGLSITGWGTVTLSESNLINNGGFGLSVGESAKVSVQNTTVAQNALGLAAHNEAWLSLIGSMVVDNLSIGVLVWYSAHSTIEDCSISFNGGAGITVANEATLDLRDSRIVGNGRYGVLAYCPDCVPDYKRYFEFTGKVMGGGNTIPGPEEADGNRVGAVCPEKLRPLTEP